MTSANRAGIYGVHHEFRAQPPQILVLEGLQGTGKTTLALELEHAGAARIRYTVESPAQAFWTPTYLYVSNPIIVLDRWWHSRWVFRERGANTTEPLSYGAIANWQKRHGVIAWYFSQPYPDAVRVEPTVQEVDRFHALIDAGLLEPAPPRHEIERWVAELQAGEHREE